MATAFVLLNTELGSETEMMNELNQIDEVKETYMIYGVYDIIARVDADTMEDLKNIINWKIRRLFRVRSTLTMIVVWYFTRCLELEVIKTFRVLIKSTRFIPLLKQMPERFWYSKAFFLKLVYY